MTVCSGHVRLLKSKNGGTPNPSHRYKEPVTGFYAKLSVCPYRKIRNRE